MCELRRRDVLVDDWSDGGGHMPELCGWQVFQFGWSQCEHGMWHMRCRDVVRYRVIIMYQLHSRDVVRYQCIYLSKLRRWLLVFS